MHRTRFGRAMRAVAERPEAAQILGVSVRRINVLTFVLTSVMAGIIGFFAAVSVGSAPPGMAAWLTGKGLVGMVLGGLRGLSRAILRGLALRVLVLGVVVAAVVGLLVGFPALRVRGLYLAIATFGFGEIVRLAFLNVRYTRRIGDRVVGPNASEGFRHVRYIYDRGITPLEYLGIILLALAVVVVLFFVLERSKLGATLRAVEEDEVAASMVGINVTRAKVFGFTAAAGVAGGAGGVFVPHSSLLDHHMVGLPLAIASVTYPIFGGLGSFVGPLLGAVVLVGLTESLRALHDAREIIYGALIILTMLFRPRGLVDEALVLRVKGWLRPRAVRRPAPAP